VAHGRDAVLRVQQLLSDDVDDVVYIIDADYEQLRGSPPAARSVISTDGHDLEMMLFASSALDKVLAVHGASTKVAAFEQRHRSALAGLLLSAAPLGALRWISLRDGLNLDFEGLDMSRWLDSTTLAPDIRSLVTTAIGRSQRIRVPVAEVAAEVDRVLDAGFDPMHLCCGHDLTAILSLGLTRALGSQRHQAVTPTIIGRAMELAYEDAWFAGTGVYARLRQWEVLHSPLRLLR
jgi:hypothetical protein